MLAVHSDAGGSGDVSQLLSMAEVLNNQAEYSTRVLYAAKIDVNAVEAAIENIISYQESCNLTTSLIDDNNNMMAASNSERFYTGAAAQAQFSSMADVNDSISILLSNIKNISDSKGDIINAVNNYNTKLAELKKDCRIKLLRDAADKWNLEKHEKNTVRGLSSTAYPQKETVFGDTQYVKSEPINIQCKTYDNPSSYAAADQSYTYDRVYYKIIKYWSGLKNISWFKDPAFQEVEAMFAEVGAQLPYTPSLIID